MRFLSKSLLVAVLGFYSLPARADTMVYDVYASGVHVLEATLTIDEAKGRYNIVMNSHTRGFLGAMVPWKGTFTTKGWLQTKSGPHPEVHIAHTISDGEEGQKEFRYTQSVFKELLVTEKGKTKKTPPEPELTKGTIDTLTGALKMLKGVGAGKDCEGASDIYDGRRRFTQTFHPKAAQTISPTTYNVYSGPASVCTVEVTPKGGAWHKKPRGWMSIQEQGRKAGALPTLWIAKVNEKSLPVPVKIQVKTAYGTLMLHLAEYRAGGKVIQSKKRKS